MEKVEDFYDKIFTCFIGKHFYNYPVVFLYGISIILSFPYLVGMPSLDSSRTWNSIFLDPVFFTWFRLTGISIATIALIYVTYSYSHIFNTIFKFLISCIITVAFVISVIQSNDAISEYFSMNSAFFGNTVFIFTITTFVSHLYKILSMIIVGILFIYLLAHVIIYINFAIIIFTDTEFRKNKDYSEMKNVLFNSLPSVIFSMVIIAAASYGNLFYKDRVGEYRHYAIYSYAYTFDFQKVDSFIKEKCSGPVNAKQKYQHAIRNTIHLISYPSKNNLSEISSCAL